jgi:hypothetical protein
LRNDLGAKERQLDRLQGFDLDTLSSEELTELVGALTAAADRVRRIINLRHVQHISTSRCQTGTSSTSDSGIVAAVLSRGNTASAMSVSGSPDLNHRQALKLSRGSRGTTWPNGKDSRSRDPVVDQLGALLSSNISKRSLDMDRRVSIDNLIETDL